MLTITPWFPPFPGHRLGNYIYDSVEATTKLGVKQSVLVVTPYHPFRGSKVAKRSFFNLPIEQVWHFSFPKVLGLKNSTAIREFMTKGSVLNAFNSFRPDIVHVHTESLAHCLATLKKNAEFSSFLTVHGQNTAEQYNSVWHNKYIRENLKFVDRVVAVGAPLRSFLDQHYGRSEDVLVIPNGFRDFGVSGYSHFQHRALRLVSVSNVVEGKGIDIAIDALYEVWRSKEFEFVYTVVGSGDQVNSLRRKVSEYGMCSVVQFLGPIPHSNVGNILKDFDVFLLPSYREAFGVAYLEAIGCGLLAIGVEGQGAQDFIEHLDTGILAPPRDSAAIAYWLKWISNNRTEASEIARKGQLTVRQKFTWNCHANKLVDAYRGALVSK